MNRYSFYRQILLLVALHCFCNIVFTQSISNLKHDLDKATSNKLRADISFTISWKYTDLLKIDSALYFADRTRDFSRLGNYEIGTGKYWLVRARSLSLRNRIDEALECLDHSIEIFAKHKALQLLGLSYLQSGSAMVIDIELAKKNYWQAIYFLELANDSSSFQRVHYEIGRLYLRTDDYDSSAVYLTKALAIAEALNDKNKVFNASGYLGTLFLVTGEIEKSHHYLDYALRNQTGSTSKVMIRTRLCDYAETLITKSQFRRVDSVLKIIEAMNNNFNDAWGWIMLNKLKGLNEFRKKNYTGSLQYLRNAYNRRSELGASNNTDIKNIILNLGVAEYENGMYDSAIVHFRTCIEMCKELKYTRDEMHCNLLISQAFEKEREADSALHYFHNYNLLRDSLLTLQRRKTILEVSAKYESEKKEQEITILQKESEASSYVLRLRNQEIEKQRLENERNSQALKLVSQQNEINKLDAAQKALNLDNAKKENERNYAKLDGLQKEAALQAAVARNQEQRKNFAYGLLAVILIFSVYGYYRYRQNKKLSNQLSRSINELKQAQEQLIKFEKEKASESIRVRISRDIHDEVGATLSGVALYSEIAKEKMEQHNEQDAQLYLDHISANSKDMVEKMGDIIWTINPANDSMDRIIAKLRSYAVNLCSGKNIQVHFQVDEEIKDCFPDMSERKNIYLFSKEAINNAVKYSGCRNIFYLIKPKDNKIILEVRDDGKGFDKDVITAGNGLVNMQARAGELSADLQIDSVPGEGTCIQLTMKFHPIGGQKEIV